ncbi:macro domain-containing protein [Streptomyces sp. NPDC050546]|uniref:macro domain-containing protein n=1 Tax=Streptomyces sp. NPDC050546 TaxID=3365628 RepID=UPI00378D59B8
MVVPRSGTDRNLLPSGRRGRQRESLRVADGLGARTVAFPAISTGVYGYPMEEAAGIAVDTVRTARTDVEEVRFVLFDAPAYEVFAARLR